MNENNVNKITEEICQEMAVKAISLMQKHGLPETQENANILHEAMVVGMNILLPKVDEKMKQIIANYEKQIAEIFEDEDF